MSKNPNAGLEQQNILETELGTTYADVIDFMQANEMTINHNLAWWIAWQLFPKQLRERAGLPKFQGAFVTKWLGLSRQAVDDWRETHGEKWLNEYLEQRKPVGKRILEAYEEEIFDALGKVASKEDVRASADRKTALQVLGHIGSNKLNVKADGETEIELDWGE